MNLGDLQSARSKERQRDSLQHLDDAFYENVGAYVAELRAERGRVADTVDDPFDAPEVRRLTDDIKAAENTVEAIYERRVGKLVKLASLAAAGMPADTEGLTTEETDLFETLVGAIESNRKRVLDDVLAGDRAAPATDAATPSDSDPRPDDVDPVDAAPADGADATPPDRAGDGPVGSEGDTAGRASPAEAEGGVSAADAMGGGPSSRSADESPSAESEPPSDAPPADRAPAGVDDAGGETPESDTERTTVRITRDIGEVFGVDERTYHLSAEDVVTLPEVNATPLLERDAAEELG